MRALQIVEAEICHLEAQIARVEQGELPPALFQKLRLQYGVYSMRDETTRHMIRLRIPLGMVTPEQLECVADVCETYATHPICHLTTRQTIQLYGIERQEVPYMLRRLAAAGVVTREASGNVVRNVACCPWAGMAPDEPFDVTPYAQAIARYLLRNPLTQLLPRKVKIAFEGCPTDHARLRIHDIGLHAALQQAQRGFRIYVGGGLGAQPRAGQLLEPWTPMTHVLPTVEAILRVFERQGDRVHRARARLKFLIERVGWDTFAADVLRERELVWATQSGRSLVALREPVEGSMTPELISWNATHVQDHKEPGRTSVLVRVPCGDITAAQLRVLAQIARVEDCTIRLTNQQDLLLRNVASQALPRVYARLQDSGLPTTHGGRLADVTRCPGADTCLSAITRPRGLAHALERLFHDGLAAWADAPLAIKISGCPNACGHHHIADIGCFGAAAKVGDRYLPCYQLLVGGSTAAEQVSFGQRVGKVPAQRAPEAIRRVVNMYATQRQADEPFRMFVARVGLEPFRDAVRDLADVSRADHEPSLTVDLGTSEPFVLHVDPGECAA